MAIHLSMFFFSQYVVQQYHKFNSIVYTVMAYCFCLLMFSFFISSHGQIFWLALTAASDDMSSCEKAVVTDTLKDRPGGISLLCGHLTWTMMDKGTLTRGELDTSQSRYIGELSGNPHLCGYWLLPSSPPAHLISWRFWQRSVGAAVTLLASLIHY